MLTNINPTPITFLTKKIETTTGEKTVPGASNVALSATSLPLQRGCFLQVTDLGGGSYVKIGTNNGTFFDLKTLDTFMWIDFVSDVKDIIAQTDGTNAKIAWWGG